MKTSLRYLIACPLLVSITALMGCGGTDANPEPTPPVDELLAPPPAGEGVQFKMVTELAAGTEAEHCMFVRGPTDGMFVSRDEVRYSKGSHHILVYETEYTDIPTEKANGDKVDTSGVFDCSDGATNGWAVTKLVGGSQNADGTSMLSFPPGVAMKVRPNAVLLMNAHYVNATSEALTPEVRVNMYTIPEAEVKTEGDILFLYNPFIYVGANGANRARMQCMVHTDITIQNVQSHMHARGNGYEARVVGEAEPFYTNTAWEGVPVKDFGAGLEVKAGSFLDYHCDYKNTGMGDVFQGPRSTDEMCMLIGSYYPADPYTANCQRDTSMPLGEEAVGADWVGNGTATCAQTFSCVQSALVGGKGLKGLTPCITASDPSISKEMSASVRCLFNAYGAGKDPAMACQAEFATCMAK
jgi:Copper type II ascorbate-dependent monooxygenase, C-terminal domain